MTSEHSSERESRFENQDSFHFHGGSQRDHGSASARDADARFSEAPRDDDRSDSGAAPDHPGFADDHGDEPTDAESTPTEAASGDATARPKRRRGSRGGRRRRGKRREGEGFVDASTTEGPILREDAVPETGGYDDETDTEIVRDDVAGEAPEMGDDRLPDAAALELDGGGDAIGGGATGGAKKRRRRGRRRRGRGTDAPESERPRLDEDGGPVEPILPDDDDFAPRAPSIVPRELDAFDDEDLDAAPAAAVRAEPRRGGGRPPERARAARVVAPRIEIDRREIDADEVDAGEGDEPRAEEGDAPDLDGESSAAPGDSGGSRKKRRRRGTRGGRRRKQKLAEGRGTRALPSETPLEIESIPGEDDDLPELPELPVEAELVPLDGDFDGEGDGGAPQDARRGRSRRKKRGERRGEERASEDADDDDLPSIPESQRTALILVNATDPEEHRVAVVEDERIVDFQMTVKDQDSLVNDIYRGRVVNLEPAIGAAFIDFGQGRNGFLHTSDVLSIYGDKDWSLDKLLSTKIDPEEWDAGSSQPSVGAELSDDDGGEKPEPQEKGGRKRGRPKGKHERRFRSRPRLPITDLLKKGQMVVVQVTKDAIGDKGPTLTTYISIPGRYLVLMPSMSRTGVSRKIEDEKERKRLKRILQSLDVPEGMGVIVRTAGVGHSKAEIKRDLDYLKSAWDAFGKRLSVGHGPAPLYRESDVAIRTMRDLFTPTTKAVIVDDPEVHRHITEFTEKLMPENVERVKLHDGQRPLFQSFGIEPDFEKIFSRRIELPSGGSVVFDQAEALVAIDVNSGRTRSDGFDFEEIALKTNLEAVPEIARQIRLRDLGGIIVVDFIDMMKMGNIRTVERAFKSALDLDRARSKLGRISQFGLLELTRQRLGPGIAKKAFHTCPRCRGTGRIRTVNSRAAAILRRLGSAMTLKGFTTVEVKAHPEVVAYLKDQCNEYIRALEYRFQRDVKLFDAPEQHEDSVLRYLRADGKEVRPGGRRKR